MIGVIVVPGHSSAMHGLDERRSLALLPLGDRPLLQHVVEALVAQKITKIEMIVDHAPEAVEALLGNGDRWGCRFRYHLVSQQEYPYRSLKIIPELKEEPWILIHALSYPFVDNLKADRGKPVVFLGLSENGSGDGSPQQQWHWMGAAAFPSGPYAEAMSKLTVQELNRRIDEMAASPDVDAVQVPQWLDASSPEALLKSQTLLLERRLDGMTLSGVEREPGVWVSRNVVVHPTASLVAPVYIGPNTRLNRGVRVGPNAVLEGECIVDTNTSIENSLVTAGSYIGERLELDTAIVDHNLLINVRLGTSVNIMEGFLLGGLKRRSQRSWLTSVPQSLIAFCLSILFLPITLLAAIFYGILTQKKLVRISALKHSPNHVTPFDQFKLLCFGEDAWNTPIPAGWSAFTRQFLPGLMSVIRRDISFVGLPPRSPQEVAALPSEWRDLYLSGPTGLITEASLAMSDPTDETQCYLADAYYSVRRGTLYNLKLAGKYFLRLIVPA
ncbi:MAG: NDP-sugar synthase [Edaphobacter sp.]|uniref:NDP-sugar synthase n=1 Tax=Edaphobacter sp. TaxID=1934404 RepID=UPI0023919C21|nr:NDP-sugar synthase [Edaphobacter sp.]MDE1175191.1 NDP-sugar synthase [Edaphobacter sp.]